MVLPPRLLRPSRLPWLLLLLLLLQLLLGLTAAAKPGGRAHSRAAKAAQAARQHHHPSHEKPSNVGNGEFFKGRICIGTNGRMSVPSNREHHYRNLRDRFTNCTYIDGNLELTWLEDPNLDLSFLQYIREVTGYVLISQVDVKRIILPRLQIIRGRTLFKMNVRTEEFALMVMLCNAFTLELPALRDILSGNVGIYQNFNMCHLGTIDWEEIMTGQNATLVHVYDYKTSERVCPDCDKSCKAGCWGEGPENCQMFSKTNCSPQCYQGRCFGSNPRECCHLFCAGGCTGPKQSDCLACRNFIDDEMCTQECPPMQTYNPTTYSWEPNVNGKYAYGATCVKNCPEHLLKDNGACVRTCPPKKTAIDGECVTCDGPCPKSCMGVKSVHSGNVDKFKGCTIIDGNLEILEQSFRGFHEVVIHTNNNFTFGDRYAEMDPDKLEIFSTLKEVTGYVNIQGHHEKFTNLSYFRNLETIGGRQLTIDNFFASLYIVKTALKSLELQSLKKIHSGAVVILENKNLCYVKDIAWKKIQKSTDHSNLLKNNRADEECKELGLVCDQQCTSDGCWGFGPNQCLECRNFKFGDTCLENCNHTGMYEAEGKKCLPCHSECASTCNGPKPENCTKCKNARDGPFCVSECPITKFISKDGYCLECHANCVDGCLGPNNTIGPSGCNSCEKAVINGDVTVEKCLQKNESCPDGYYYEWVGPQEQGPLGPLAGKAICRRCHPRCKKCTGYGFHEQVCQECTKFKRGEQCEDECPDDHYVDENTQICVTCHPECRKCMGPEPSDCKKCRNLRIYMDGMSPADNSSLFNCSDACPPSMPHKIFPNERNLEPYCSSESANKFPLTDSASSVNLIVILSVILICILSITISITYYVFQHRKENDEAVKMTKVLTGYGEDNELLHTTHVLPNIAKLRIIKEAELRKGGILGFGAFGKVFQGVWVPDGGTIKVPVAIKELRQETGVNLSKEFLDETYIMATVDHPNLLQLLAVCLTQDMLLITQLMPLGCLLDYVRTNKQKIGSKALLTWCTQIARGMAYLEEKRLVHRDLAARNVLVQTPSLVKITDFGLAKLLDVNEDEYRAAGGKMPIKWLALECIQHRIFTHKSDVWAFGVTVWELLTYGGRPYENISARDVPELIENGLKLPQPSICSLDIYLIMVSCWMLDADSRPSFSNLATKFAEMASDPGRYLVIQGDKFMKLPSYTPQDEKEMISNLATGIDTSESVTGAEYLQPTLEEGVSATTSAGCSSALDRSCFPSSSNCDFHHRIWHPGMGDSISDSMSQLDMAMRSPLKCSSSTDPRQYYNCININSDSSSSKYNTVQMKHTSSLDDISTDDAFDSPTRDSQSSSAKKELPVDEDDYLMPFPPPQSTNGTSYIDLISDSSKGDSTASRSCTSPKPGCSNISKVKQGLDNPEYLLTSTENLHTLEEVCIPKNADEGDSISLPAISCEQPTMDNPVGLVSQKSVEEESVSDHEYYNDLQRELQPLRRNETAV